MKKILISALVLMFALTACGSGEESAGAPDNRLVSVGTPPGNDASSFDAEPTAYEAVSPGGRIVVSTTNASGAEAVPVAFDVHSQLFELLEPGAESQTGYDADVAMSWTILMEGDSWVNNFTTAVTGNMRVNIDGSLVQSTAVLDRLSNADVSGTAFSDEIGIEIYMETVGMNITNMRGVIGGEAFEYSDEPFEAEWMRSYMPEMNMPDFEPEAIVNAEITQVGGEIHISLVLDAEQLTDFAGEMMLEAVSELGAPREWIYTNFDEINYSIVLDSEGRLLRMYTNMAMNMYGAADDEAESGMQDISAQAEITREFIFNRIGSIEIVVPEH